MAELGWPKAATLRKQQERLVALNGEWGWLRGFFTTEGLEETGSAPYFIPRALSRMLITLF